MPVNNPGGRIGSFTGGTANALLGVTTGGRMSQITAPGGPGVLFNAGSSTSFWATLAAGSTNDIQYNRGDGFFNASSNFNFADASQFTVSGTPTRLNAPSSAYGVPVLNVYSEDAYVGYGSTLFKVETADPTTAFAVNDWGELTLNNASALALPGNIQGVASINGIANFGAQGSAGDVQISDGAFGFTVDSFAFIYDIGSQTLTTPNLTVNNTFNFLGQIPISSGGTGAPDADTAIYNFLSSASTQGIAAPIPGTDKFIPFYNQSFGSAGRIQLSELFQYNAPSILVRYTGINAKTVANTGIVTASVDCIVTGFIVRCTAANTIATGPSAGMGNAAGTNNIIASQAMTLLVSTADTYTYFLAGASKKLAAGQTLYFNLGTAATGTSMTIAVDVIGYSIV